jgi:FkbM family methyltransferase
VGFSRRRENRAGDRGRAGPRHAGNLEQVIGLNGLDNVRVVPKALGAAPGTINLWLVPQASGLTSAVAPADATSAQRVEVPMSTLDDELLHAGGPAPTLIKIDVEGYELAVLQGAIRTLSGGDGPAVLFETQQEHLLRAGGRFADVPGWFEDQFGYRLFALLQVENSGPIIGVAAHERR